MPRIDSILFNKKAEKKYLTLQLSEGEDILGCLKQGLLDHKINECKVEDASGKIKSGVVNFFEGSKFMKRDLKDDEVIRATGNFKLSFGDLWGSMHVFVGKKRPFSATFVNGKAAEGFELKLSFIQDIKEGQKQQAVQPAQATGKAEN